MSTLEVAPAPVLISVKIDEHSNREECSCPMCGTRMLRASLSYQYEATNPGTIETDQPVPGYRCDDCDASCYPADVARELYAATLQRVTAAEDRAVLQAAIKQLDKALTR